MSEDVIDDSMNYINGLQNRLQGVVNNDTLNIGEKRSEYGILIHQLNEMMNGVIDGCISVLRIPLPRHDVEVYGIYTYVHDVLSSHELFDTAHRFLERLIELRHDTFGTDAPRPSTGGDR